jgi:hypothetical protein
VLSVQSAVCSPGQMQSFNKMDFRMVLLCIAVSQIGTVVRSQSVSPQFSMTTNTINILENATASTSTRLLEFSVSDNGNTGRVISVICNPNSSVPADTCSKFSVLATSNSVGSWHGYIYFQGGSLNYLDVPKYTMVLLAIVSSDSVIKCLWMKVCERIFGIIVLSFFWSE